MTQTGSEKPPLHYDRDLNDLHAPALSEIDMRRLKVFHRALAREHMEYCQRCREKWFDMNLHSGVCSKCRYCDKYRSEELPFLMSSANFADPGPVHVDMPALTQVEEMKIARVHVFIEIRQVCGQQYKYSGHVCNFHISTRVLSWRCPVLQNPVCIDCCLRYYGSQSTGNDSRQGSS